MVWILLVLLVAFVYFALIKPFRYWKNKGVSQPKISTLWLQNIQVILKLKAQTNIYLSIYNSFKNQRYGGWYQFFTPMLFLKDPDLIKQITVKDFDHFVDHRQFISGEAEPLMGKNLFALKGVQWRDMRATLSPSFTSSKMRAMFSLMNECAEQFIRHCQNENSNTVIIEFKDAFTRYANDVIASTAFGVNCDSLKEPENEFYLMGKEATNFRGFWLNIKLVLMMANPQLSKLLGVRMFSKHVSEFFRRLVRTNIEAREKNNIVRPDMIHLLMEARKGRLKHEENPNKVEDSGFAVIEESSVGKEEKRQKRQLTNDDITAQALIFFFAGFDGVSTLMCFAVYELATNPEIQKRLQDEADETLATCGGSLTYERLLKMKYLNMVVSEVLRKWPVAIGIDRVCVKPYTIMPAKAGEHSLTLQKGDVLWLPIFPIHRDPYFYPDPERFNPERFNDENKFRINPYFYIPFGAEPRSCIGNRFALLEVKTVLFYILSKFDINVVEKSPVPMKLTKHPFNLNSEKGFWFALKPRAMVK